MAIMQPSALVSSISGSIGGVTFKMTKSGLLATKRARRQNQRTQHQLAQHKFYLRCLGWFRSLNSTRLSAWQDAARAYNRANRLGLTKPASPWSLFLEANYFLAAMDDDSGVYLPTITRLPGPEYVIAWFPTTNPWLLAPWPEVDYDPQPLIAVSAGRTCSPANSQSRPQLVFCPNAYWYQIGPPGSNYYIDFEADLEARQGPALLYEMIHARVQYFAAGYLPSSPATTEWRVGPEEQPKP